MAESLFIHPPEPVLVGRMGFGEHDVKVLRTRLDNAVKTVSLLFGSEELRTGNAVSALALGDALEITTSRSGQVRNDVYFGDYGVIVYTHHPRGGDRYVAMHFVKTEDDGNETTTIYKGGAHHAYVLGRMIQNVAKGL